MKKNKTNKQIELARQVGLGSLEVPYPSRKHFPWLGRKNARAAGPIMIEGLLACSKDTIAQVYKPITECNEQKNFITGN